MTSKVNSNFFGIISGKQSSSNEEFSCDSGGNSMIYAIYPVLSSYNHGYMKDYMNSFPNNTVSFPIPVYNNAAFYAYARNNVGTVRVYAMNNYAAGFFTGQHITLPDDPSIKEKLTENVGLIMSSNDNGYTSYNNLGPITGIEAIKIK